MNKGYRELPDWADRRDLDDRTKMIIIGCRMLTSSEDEVIHLRKTMSMRNSKYGKEFDDKLIKFYDQSMLMHRGGEPWKVTAARTQRAVAIEKWERETAEYEQYVDKKKSIGNILGILFGITLVTVIYFGCIH